MKKKENKSIKVIKGFTAYAGKVIGTVKLILSRSGYGKIKKDDILVAINTNPDYSLIVKKVKAIVTDEGGLTCHAAIIAREMKIPCIVGTKIATQVFKTGDLVEVDAGEGIVRIIKKARRV